MDITNLENKFKIFKESIYFNYSLKKLNWFNIGGNTKIYFKASNLNDLINFLKLYGDNNNLFILGAGSNVLFKDVLFDGAVIKLSKNFSKISLLNENTIIAGSGTLDKSLSEFALKNSLSGFEFLSCIPGTIGGGIRMNSGCFENEFKDILISVQAVSRSGQVLTIPAKNIIFGCTGTIGETFPVDKITLNIPDLVKNIKYTQNKFIWMKAALGMMTTDTQPKMAMEECHIGNTLIKIYGVAKGSGMIHPNMATTLGYIFTDADLPNEILKKY